MIVTLFYFSGTGNTEYICKKFVSIAKEQNSMTELYNIEKLIGDNENTVNTIINNSDVIGFAYPVYGANLPRIVSQFIERIIPLSEKKRAFIISTVGYINAYGPFIIRKKLNSLNLRLRQHLVYKCFNNTKIKKPSIEQQDEIFKKRKRTFLLFYENIMKDSTYYNGIGPWIIGGYIARKIFAKKIKDHYKEYYVDTTACTRCLVCINNCPVSAIKIEKDEFIFNEKCITCFRCRNNCPANALKEKNA